MNTVNTSTGNVSPPASAVHINDLLPRLNKPDDQVGGSVGFVPVIGNVVPDGATIATDGTTVPNTTPDVVTVHGSPGAGSTAGTDVNPHEAELNRIFSIYTSAGANSDRASASYPLRDAISTNVTPPPVNAVILVDRYLLMEPVEGNNLYRCYDIKSHEELVCKIANNPCSNLLTAHFRLDGHQHVNSLHKVIQGNNQTYLLYSPSEGDLHSYVRVRKRLREPEARRLCRQMCEVVKSCHEQGIVLRDLKLRKFVFADRESLMKVMGDFKK
uniref:Protein kinase domain-containing protein n=1 Tax=Anopheles culicifacies TaxID=139723 RepID=A0A182LX31_9DIPT